MKSYDIPIDFCPNCKNKKIRVVLGLTYEAEYSLSGKCLKKHDRFPDTTYTLLKCPKCGWTSSSWSEAGMENPEEYEYLEQLYLKENGVN